MPVRKGLPFFAAALFFSFGLLVLFNRPALAGYRVQRGRTQVVASPTDAGIPDPVDDVNKTWVLITRGTGSMNSNQNADEVCVRGYLLDNDTVRFHRVDTATQSSWVSWQVIEATSGEFEVYRGGGIFGASAGDANISIGATVNSSNCFAWVTADNSQNSRSYYDESELTAYVMNSTHVRIQRDASGSATVNFNWTVVEFSPSKIGSIQTGETVVTTNTSSSPQLQAISPINTSTSILIYQHRTTNNGIVYAGLTGRIDNATSMRFYKHLNFASTNTVRWHVIDFGGNAARQNGTIDNSGTSNWYTLDRTLSPAVDTNSTITFHRMTCSGTSTGSAYPRPFATNLLLNSTSYRIQRMRQGQPTWNEWQLLQLPTGVTIEVNGTVYTNEAKSGNIGEGKNVSISVGGDPVDTVTTNADGQFNFTGILVEPQQVVLVYLDGESEAGSLVTVTDGETPLTGVEALEMYTGKVVLEYQNGTELNNTLLDVIDGVDAGNEDGITVSGSDVTFAEGFEVWIDGGMTYRPEGEVAADAFEVTGAGVFDPAGNQVTVSGNFTVSQTGSFTSSGTVIFDGASPQVLIPGGTDAAHDFQNLEHSGSGVLQLEDAGGLDVDDTLTQSGTGDFDTQGYAVTVSNLTVTGGTFNADADSGTWAVADNLTVSGSGSLTATSGVCNISGSFVNSGTFAHNNGAVIFNATSGSETIDAPAADGAFYDLITEDGGGGATWTLSGDVAVDHDLNVSGGTFAAAGNDITIAGNWTVDSVDGAYTSGTNTVYFDGSATQTLSPGGTDADHDFQNIEHSGAGTLELAPGSDLDADGTLTQSGPSDFDTQGRALTLGALTVTDGTFNAAAGTGAWTVNGAVTVSGSGSLTATSGSFDVKGDFVSSGTFIHNNARVSLSAASGSPSLDVPPSSGAFHDLVLDDAGNGITFSLESDLLVENNVTITNGTLEGNTHNITVRGSWDNNDIFSASGSSVLFTSNLTGNIIESGTSAFFNLQLNNATGGWTIQTDNLTTLGNFTLNDCNLSGGFIVEAGRRIQVNGTFRNLVGGAATDWGSGTTLNLTADGGGSYTVNTNASGSDVYQSLEVGADTDVRIWHSSASAYTVAPSGSLYSMDHADTDGDLYIWGDYHVPANATDYWSYAADFDGTDLTGGNRRQVGVRLADAAQVTVTAGKKLEIKGESGNATTVNRQSTGSYGIDIVNGTLEADRYEFDHINGNGLNISGADATVISLDNGDFDNSTGSGSQDAFITVSGEALDNNGAFVITAVNFDNNGGAADFNVRATGAPVSFWDFDASTGSFDGEANDADPGGDPGNLVWDDSSAASITVSGTAYTDDDEASAVNNANVSLAVNDQFEQSVTTSGVDGTYSFSGVSVSVGDTLTIFFVNESFSGSSVVISESTDATGIPLYQNHVLVRSEPVGSVSIAQMAKYDKDDDADINFDAEDLAVDTLVIDDGAELFIPAGEEFQPLGNLESGTAGVFDLDNRGTFTLVSDEVIRVSGNWTNAGSAVFGPASSVVKFDAPGGARTIDSGGDNFYDLVVDGAASYTLEASLTANNNLTVSAGTLATGTYTVTTTGTLAVSGGTITATGGNIDADGDVAISSGTLTAPGAGNSFTIAGDYLNSGGTFISGGGKVSFDKASGTQTINAGGTGDVNRDFDDLEKTGSGILQLVSTGLEVDGTMTIASGRTVDLNGRSLNLGTLDNSGTLQMTGTETAVSIAAMDTAKGKTLYVGDGNDVAEVHSLKEIGALDYHDLTVNDAAGITDTYRTGAHLHVNGILEVLSGTLDISTNGNSLTVTEAAGINGGSLSATDGNIDANANLTLASGTLSAPTSGQYFRVFGNLSLSGSFTHSSGTLTFDANSSVRSIDTGGNTLYDLVFDDSAGGATWTLNSDLTGHNLTITGGTLDTGSDRAIVLSGNWVNDDIFVSNTGTVTFNNASGIQTLDAGGTADANKDFNHLTKSAGGTLQLNASGLEADGTLTVSSGCSLELNGRNLNAGTLVNSGTVVVQGPEVVNITAHETSAGTVKYVGDGDASPETHTIAGFGSSEYNHLVINDANPTRDSFQASEDVTVDGDMTVDGGTFIAGSHNLGVDGNLSVSSGTLSAPGGGRTLTISGDLGVAASFGHNTGQVVFNNSAGETTLNAPGGGLIFHDLASQTAGKVIRFTAADTFIVNGAFTIDGTSNATRITLNSTTPDTAWNLILNGTHNVQFVNVRDSSASGVAPLPVNPDNSVDMGNNVNWFPLEQVEGDNTIRSGQDRHTFYDGSNFWAFLIDDGGNVVYKKDDDGIDWPSGNTTLAAGDFTSLGIWEDGTHVWCAYTDGGSLLVKNVTIATGAQGSEFEIIEDFMMEWGNVSGVNGTFQTVTTVGDYGNGMVVAASGDYPDNTSNVTIPRIQNAASSSFEIKSQEPCGSNPETLNMRYVVTKTTGAGTVIPGTSIPFEAQTYLSTVTDGKSNGWNGEDQVYQNSYSSPRVAGQVMTYNDSGWSIFWAHGTGGDNNPPDSALLATGKHTGEWSGSRADETIGFLVTNAAHGTINGIAYEIGRTPASVDRIDESNYTHNFSPAFSSAPQVAVVSTVGINGNDGPHAHLVGTTASGIILATEEDQCSDTERAGSSEEVDYLVFESPGGYYGGDVNHVQIIKGSDGYFWVKWENGANDVFTMRSAAAGNESAWDPHYVVKSSTDSASWGHNQIVPANGTVQYFYQEGNTLYVKNFSDPASQGPALTVAVDCAAAGNESVWNETHYFSVVTDDLGIPYVIYQNTSGYIRYNVLNGTDWLSEPVTTSTNGSCSHPALFYDSEYDTVFAFWVEGSTIRYKRSTSQKQGYWGNETVFKSGLDNPRFLNTAYSDNSTIGVLWREGEGSYISYGTLPLASTIVDLVDFFALGLNSTVQVRWRTASEIDNAGFNIYRSQDAADGFTKITAGLVAGLGTSLAGQSYVYNDTTVTPGLDYYYILESVEYDGTTRRFGPVAAHPGKDTDADGMSDDYEYFYGLNPAVNDASGDPDGDGLTNLDEYNNITDPFSSYDAALSWSDPSPTTAGVTVISSSDSEIVLELVTNRFEADNKTAGNETYQLLRFPEYAHSYSSDEGKPMVALKGVLLAMPDKKPLGIEVLDSELESFPDYTIYPVPQKRLVVEGGVTYLQSQFYRDNLTYAQNAFYPGELVGVDYANYLRDQAVARVVFYPLHTNPVTEEVYLYKRIRVKLTTQNTSGEAALISPGSGVPQGTASAYKIAVTADGVYRLSYDNLTAAGMDAGDVAPESFKLYNKGNELAVSVSGSTDGSFDAGDYLEFWGRKENTRYTYTNVYWLTFGGTGGERMENTSAQGGAVQEGFLHPHHHESNDFYWSEFRNAGDPWYLWPFVQAGNTESFTVTLQDVLNSERMGVFTGSFRGYSRYDVPSFHARLYINDYLIDDVSWQGNDTYNATVQIPSYWLSEGPNTVKVEHVLDNPAEPLSWVFADWFDISYWRNLTAQADYLLLGASGAGTYAFTVGNFSDSDISVYDVSNATGVRRVVNTTVAPDGLNYQVSFNASASAGGKYALVSQGGIRYPVQILADTPSDLQNASNQADYIIITYDDFHDAVRPLAEHRRDAGLSVIVANISDVYDEFNYGISSPEAIKSFLEYAYTSWQDPAPTYVLLVGDGTYDYRNDEGWGFTDYLPSYLIYNEEFGETSTDDWFVCFDGEDDLLSDMLIGRFPAKSRAEAAQMVNKTIAYESRDISADWTKNMLFVSDDEASFEAINNRLRNETSGDYTSSGIYLSRYGNPLDARAEVIQGISNGSLMVTYSGHGGIQIWADEEMLRVEDVDSLTNSGKYPLMVMLNCVNGHFIQPMFFECLGEELLRPEERGAAAVFAPSGMSLPEHQSILAEGLYDSLFKKEERILGSAVAEAKMYLFQEAGTAVGDVLQSFILFGDPALILRKPALPGAPDAGDPGVFTSVGDTILPLSTFSVSQDATMTLPALLFEGQGDLRQDTAGGALMPPEEGTVSGQGLQRVAERLQAGAPEETGPGGGLQETQPVTQLVVPLSPSGKAPGAKGVVLPKKTGTVGLIPRMMRRQTRSL